MEFTAELEQFQDSSLYAYHVMVPDKIAQKIMNDTGKRVVCKINNSLTHQCALFSDGKGSYFINFNKDMRHTLKLDLGDKVHIQIEADTSKYGMPVPEEFKVLLEQDPEGDRVFHSLTIGKQRSLLHIIGKPKTSETRLKKCVIMINYLKDTGGNLDFKELNEAFKLNK